MSKKILFYLSAGAGDLINFTGILNLIHNTHEGYQLDFLIKKKHAYILANHPAVDNLLFFEDYRKIPDHCTHKGHDIAVQTTFIKQYDHILNCWGCLSKEGNNGDFVGMMTALMRQYGFYLPFSRLELNPVFFYSQEDYDIVNELRLSLPNGKIVMMEDECFSWQTPQIALLPGISKTLSRNGYLTAANTVVSDFSLKSLNLKQIKLFFDLYGFCFLGLSSGMTCAMYAMPNDYKDKQLIISGFYDNWNMYKNLNTYQSTRYQFFHGVYREQDIIRILELI